MKIAKASEADLKMAMELMNALESLERYRTFPEGMRSDPDDYADFDADNSEHCREVMEYLLKLTGGASLMRVVFGMAVLLDPANQCVDPAADTLEHHPNINRYQWLRDNFAVLEFKQGDNRLHVENGDKPEHLDVLLDELMKGQT